MTTRHATPGGPTRQERYASSYTTGLLANLVAKRCAVMERYERPAIWFLQAQSWQQGGLDKIAAALIESPNLREWREECPAWPGATALELRKQHMLALRSELEAVCLDPDKPLAGVFEAVFDLREHHIESLPAITPTEVSEKLTAALEYAQTARCLTLIDGPARTGKTFAAWDWCRRSAGVARYVQVPSTNDDRAFFLNIAAALGISQSRGYSLAEIRDRIEDTLLCGDLMLVFDEAHYLWPRTRWAARPDRVNWIMTALVNQDVPVALVTTPQFYIAQKRVEDFGWASEQFIGRIGHVERLPERLSKTDLFNVAKTLLPGGDRESWNALAAYADISKKHLASIEAIVRRAEWLAARNHRKAASAADVKRAMKESVIPSDTRLAQSLTEARAGAKRRGRPATPPRLLREASALPSRREEFPFRQTVPELVTS